VVSDTDIDGEREGIRLGVEEFRGLKGEKGLKGWGRQGFKI
jgi:hypothetical protein